jgi:hypothetical protein
MSRGKPLTFGGMLVLLVIVVAFVPMALRWIRRSVAGFEDVMADSQVARVPAGASMQASSYVPDMDTNYLCRSPNDSGIPCPEGTFCDGTKSPQRCVSISAPGSGPVSGYFS